MDIDPLDPAAALAGIVHRAVHQHVDGQVQVRIRADIAGVLAAQLQPQGGEGARRRALDRLPAPDRAGEVHEAEAARADQAFGRGVVQDDVLEHILGHACRMEGLGQTFAHQQGLAGVLQHHGIPRDQGGDQGVDRGQIGIVPGRDDEDDTHGFAGEVAAELVAVLDHFGRKRLGGDAGHIVGAGVHPAKLATIAGGAAHLPGDLFHHDIGHGVQLGNARFHQGDTLLQRAGGPGFLRSLGAGDDGLSSLGRERHPFGIDAAVDGGNQLNRFHLRPRSSGVPRHGVKHGGKVGDIAHPTP